MSKSVIEEDQEISAAQQRLTLFSAIVNDQSLHAAGDYFENGQI